ncbi:MAG: benzoate/H(+) symporter BenE family transporter [Chloroflexi bacterium]|nr:benzoate/H(+) symporter BenE family transporter [Chloroflexota bacterium]
MIERGPGFLPSIKALPSYLTLSAFGYGATAWLFAVTGPFLIFVNVAKQGNLSMAELNSWIFGGYFFGGVFTLFVALYYRQPLPMAFTIPGGVLIGTSLLHLSFPEIIGAYILTGILITVLGFTGVIKRGMEWLPMPIMMGMVSGVLLPFGVGIATASTQAPLLSALTIAAFLAVSCVPLVAKRFPPVLSAIVVGLLGATVLELANWQMLTFQIAQPIIFSPVFTLPAAVEVVIPLALTVIAIQNAQGIGILLNSAYRPPVNSVTTISGLGSIVMGFLGCQSTCLAGPMTGIVANPNVGPKDGRYVAAIVTGVLWMVFGLFSPVATAVSQILPASLINLLAGLALISVLVACFNAAFAGKFRLGALFSFMITVSGLTIFNIGAPFWGLVGGVAISLFLEPGDFAELAKRRAMASTVPPQEAASATR